MQVRSYENSEGKRVYVTEVIADNVRFLESSRQENGQSESRSSNQDPFSDDGKPINLNDDDLPF
jgi:single-strand DNA-binding protein